MRKNLDPRVEKSHLRKTYSTHEKYEMRTYFDPQDIKFETMKTSDPWGHEPMRFSRLYISQSFQKSVCK